jgi:hypothetical protein
MNAYHLLFRTGRFNLSKVQQHFINSCCFGEDLARWLRGKLSERGVRAEEAYQEDWGWELRAEDDGKRYYVGVGGNSDDGTSDLGEWRIILEKPRSIRDRLMGRGKIGADDRMVKLVEEILAGQPDFQGLRGETDEAAAGGN